MLENVGQGLEPGWASTQTKLESSNFGKQQLERTQSEGAAAVADAIGEQLLKRTQSGSSEDAVEEQHLKQTQETAAEADTMESNSFGSCNWAD